jgi:hypothetical protein
MKATTSSLSTILAMAAFAALATSPANALSQKDCSAKYAAAKADGSAGTKSWNDFRKLECASNSAAEAAEPAAKDTAPADKKAAPPAQTAAAKPAAKPVPAAATTASATGAVFPKTIATAFAQESAGKSRLHTCLEQYKTNKATNSNGGLKWIQKGGGYYSECNKQLKG